MKQFIINENHNILDPTPTWQCTICKKDKRKQAILIHIRGGEVIKGIVPIAWVCSKACLNMYMLQNI